MSLPRFALRYRTVLVTAVTLLMLWGVYSYLTMSRREDPEYVVRACQVLTTWEGVPTERIEELITAPLEEEINTLDGIRWVRSETMVGRSSIIVELDRAMPGDDVPQMWDKVRSRVERVRMPEPGIRPVVIDDYGDTNIMLLAVHQKPLPGERVVREENRYTPREMDIFAQRLADELKLLPGVAKVDRAGVRQEVIYIETDQGNWSKLAMTTSALEALLDRRNVVAPGGTIDTKSGRFAVKPTDDIDTLGEIRSIIVGSVGEAGAPVYLADLDLTARRAYADPPTSITRYADPNVREDAVIVAFSMKAGANIVSVCEDAKRTVARLTETDRVLPPDIGVGFVSDQSENVTSKIRDFIWNVIGAVLIVVVVVYLMVGFRSAAVMAANIPLVIVGSLGMITLFDVQLEQISLAALIIALGMLVDNAVQVCDQTRRLQIEGKSPTEAAIVGAEQLGFPILIATGTTIAAFYPMLIGLKGSSNEYVRSLPITMTVTLALSYVIAMTFCVLLASWFIRPPNDPSRSGSPVVSLFQRLFRRSREDEAAPQSGSETDAPPGGFYPAILRAALRLRFLVVLGAFVILGFTFTLPVGSQFFPQDIRDQFTIDIWLPEGATIEQTDDAARRVEEILQALSPYKDAEGNDIQRLRGLATIVGQGMPRWYLGRNPEPPKPNFAEVVVRTTDGAYTHDYAKELRRIATHGDPDREIEAITGARVIPRELEMGPAVDAPIGIRMFGPRVGAKFADETLMREQAEKLASLLRNAPGTWDVYDSWGSPGYELYVDVDDDRANLAGVTNESVARTLNAYYSGHHLTTFREGDHLVPVFLRLPSEERGSLDALRTAYVEGRRGKVPLDAIAETKPRRVPARIERRFLKRVIEVRARVAEGYIANDIVNGLLASDAFAKWVDELPTGYTWEIGGELFESQQSASELSIALLISIMLIILLLIVQYNSVGKPIIILTTLPLALIGALGGLYVMGYPLGFMPQLGVLSLFGIVVNTAIIFIEFAETLIREKRDAGSAGGPICGLSITEFRECLVRAGQVRLLPIAMTTLTTIGGLLPLALAGGPLWEGMAWLMIFGLTIATVLTLVIVPALFAIFVENFGMSALPAEVRD